jgi:anti-sigma factor RsiW
MSTENSPVTDEELADLADPANSALSAEQRASLLARAQADPAAATELARLQQLIHLMQSDTTEDAPDWVVTRAIRLFRRQRDQAAGQPTAISSVIEQLAQAGRRLVALLQFDSAQSPLAYGMRAGESVGENVGESAPARQLIFGAEDHLVEVRIRMAGLQWQVSGQALGASDVSPGGSVTLRNELIEIEASLNDQNEFVLPAAPAGVYEMICHLDSVNVDIVIPALVVGVDATAL